MPEDFLELDALAKARGVTAVVDCGVAPGLSNLLCGRAEHEFDSVETMLILVGGLPKRRLWPFEYRVVFSGVDVIEEYLRPARWVGARHAGDEARPHRRRAGGAAPRRHRRGVQHRRPPLPRADPPRPEHEGEDPPLAGPRREDADAAGDGLPLPGAAGGRGHEGPPLRRDDQAPLRRLAPPRGRARPHGDARRGDGHEGRRAHDLDLGPATTRPTLRPATTRWRAPPGFPAPSWPGCWPAASSSAPGVQPPELLKPATTASSTG